MALPQRRPDFYREIHRSIFVCSVVHRPDKQDSTPFDLAQSISQPSSARHALLRQPRRVISAFERRIAIPVDIHSILHHIDTRIWIDFQKYGLVTRADNGVSI